MSKRNDFVEYVVKDLLSELRGVTSRAMFGGYGLYKDGVIFGIVADDELYFKVGAANREKYEAAGSKPLTYDTKKRKNIVLSYWEVPADVMDDREAIAHWAEESYKISRKAQTKTRRRYTVRG